jgi:hypothetical protein
MIRIEKRTKKRQYAVSKVICGLNVLHDTEAAKAASSLELVRKSQEHRSDSDQSQVVICLRPELSQSDNQLHIIRRSRKRFKCANLTRVEWQVGAP